jgi:hypothetical protein
MKEAGGIAEFTPTFRIPSALLFSHAKMKRFMAGLMP